MNTPTTLAALSEAHSFLDDLLDLTPAAAIAMLINHGEDVLDRIKEALKEAGGQTSDGWKPPEDPVQKAASEGEICY